MRRYLYLSTAVAGVMMTVGARASYAQCVTTQNCTELGYTETSCPDGTGIKCPFGDTFACTGGSSEITPEQCTQLGFTHTCIGTNETGGGELCNNKYAFCTCADGYEWKDGSCQKKEVINGPDGEVYKCNGTVVGVRATGMNFYIAIKDLGRMNWTNANSQCQNYSFCGNVKGTLPTLDQLKTLYNNKSQVNSLLSTNGGTKMREGSYWSSTYDSDDDYYYIVDMSDGDVGGYYGSPNGNYVRPVLASY